MSEERHQLIDDTGPEPRRYTEDPEEMRKIGLNNDPEDPEKPVDRPMETDAPQKGFKSFSFMELQLLALLILAALIIILLAVVIVVLRVSSFYYCTSPACAHQAGVMLAAMNTSVNPCQDFYKYACGRWDQVHPALPGVGKYSSFYRASERIRKQIYQLLEKGSPIVAKKNSSAVTKSVAFYKACMNVAARQKTGITPMLNLMTKLGGWTLTTSPAVKGSWDFVTMLAEFNKLALALPLYVEVTINPFNSSEHILYLSHPKLFFAASELGSSDPKYKKAFMDFGRTVANLLGNIGTTAALNAKLEKVWALEKDFVKHQMSFVDRRDPKKTNNIFTVTDVQKKLIGSSFDFRRLLKLTFGYDFKGSEKVMVPDISFIKYLAKLIKTMDNKVMANYMQLELVHLMGSKLTSSFQRALSERKKVISGSAITLPTWKFCISLTTTYFPMPLTAMYVDKLFYPEDKKQVMHMVLEIKKAMNRLIKSATWMDTSTKKVALSKLKYLKPSVAYPDNLLNIIALDNSYKKIHVNAANFFQSYVDVKRTNAAKVRAELKKPVDRKAFSMAPIIANAYYSQNTVTIKILAGIIQNPFYDHNYFATSNLGAIGSIIGHEMNHGFDSRGQQYDQHGNFNNWWSKETTKRFQAKTKCFIDQYSKYKFHGLHNKGSLTVAENMADNGGIQASLDAFQAYKENHALVKGFLPGLHLREKQLFFLAFAQYYCGHYTDAYAIHSVKTDVHSPYPHRVLGTLSNQKEFAEVFRCPKGSPYNPSKRCVLW